VTLIVLTREPGKVLCFSDSRVTRGRNEEVRTVTDHFSKLLVLPFKATLGSTTSGDLKDVRGEFGFAFAGDILFATALYSMASNVFSNLHSETSERPPDILSFADALTRLANILLDDDVFNASAREYVVILFGPCPHTGDLRIFEIGYDRNTQPWRFAHKEIEILDTGLIVRGSGAQSFMDHAKKNPEKLRSMPYAEILLDTILSEEDPTIGGNLQQCIATVDGVRIVPIIHPINSGENLDIHISGISSQKFGNVGEFHLGYDAIGFRVKDVMATQWLLENGFSKNKSENPHYVNETARMMAQLQHGQGSDSKLAGIHSFVKILSPSSIDPDRFYFLGRCGACNRPCPILEDPSGGINPEPFFGKGGLIGSCCFCDAEVRVPVARLRSRHGSK